MEESITENGDATGTDVNRHRGHYESIQVAIDDDRFPEVTIDRLEFGWLANGEVTCRWRPVGSEDWDGFVLPVPEENAPQS